MEESPGQDCAAAHKTGRTDYLPPEVEQLPGKKFIPTAVTQEVSLRYALYKFQVKAVEHLQSEEPLPPLPMLNTTATSSTSEPTDKNTASTPATSEYDMDRDQPSNRKDGKSFNETSTSQSRKRQQNKDKLSLPDHKKSHVAKQLFISGDDQDKAEADEEKSPDMQPK